MARTYEIRDLITLPRLDASSADTLVTELVTRARGTSLGASIASALKSLEERQKELKDALTSRLTVERTADNGRAKAADQALDVAFSATFDWLTGFSRLPETYEAAKTAARLLGALFPEGLKFTQLPFKLQWAEADARLSLIAKDSSFEAAFETLGGRVFLENLKKAHKEYGDALGITTTRAADPSVPNLHEPLLAVRNAIRTYALRVLAHADEHDAALAESLLAPLATWESRTATRSANAARAPGADEATAPTV